MGDNDIVRGGVKVRRAFKKSRTGCTNCKTRKVKVRMNTLSLVVLPKVSHRINQLVFSAMRGDLCVEIAPVVTLVSKLAIFTTISTSHPHKCCT